MNSEILKKINYYMLNKREQIVIEGTDLEDDILAKKVDKDVVLGFAVNLTAYGYMLDESVINALCNLSEKSVVNIYETLTSTLKEIKGADVDHSNILFKNFPDSCKRIDINTLSYNRFVSYYVNILDNIFGTDVFHSVSFDGEKESKRKDAEPGNLRKISLGTVEDFKDISRNLLSGRNSMSDFDKEIVNYTLSVFPSKEIIPDQIPFKENWAYLVKKEFEGKVEMDIKFQTLTDLIRAGVALSDGDITLSQKPIFRKFKTSEIKKLLSKLNDAAKNNKELVVESMQTKRNRRFIQNVLINGWHIDTKYDKKFPYLYSAVEDALELYSNRAMAEIALSKENYREAADYYFKSSPGEFLRHVNNLIYKAKDKDKDYIFNLIKKAGPKVSVKVLCDALYANHPESNFKVDFIKGNSAKFHIRDNKTILDNMDDKKLKYTLTNAIINQLSQKDELGKVYIDKNLKDCPVPFDTRNANGKNRSVSRGTKLPKNSNKNVIRAFCYKKNERDGFYDLSAGFLNNKFGLIEQCSWTQLKAGKDAEPFTLHSGDNVSCSIGCSEFLDVNIDKLKDFSKFKQIEFLKKKYVNEDIIDYLKSHTLEETKEKYNNSDDIDVLKKCEDFDIRYVAFQVFAWNRVPFSDMQRVFFGIMERNDLGSDKVSARDYKRLETIDKSIRKFNGGHEELYYSQIPANLLKYCEDYVQEEVYDPSTVEYRYDLTGKNLVKIPMIYDIKEEKYIFVDLDGQKIEKLNGIDMRGHESNVSYEIINKNDGNRALLLEDYLGETAAVMAAITNMNKMSLYDLFMLNAQARNAEIVEDIKDADTVYSVTKDIENVEDKKLITPFDTDIIVSDYLTVAQKDEKENAQNKDKEI